MLALQDLSFVEFCDYVGSEYVMAYVGLKCFDSFTFLWQIWLYSAYSLSL